MTSLALLPAIDIVGGRAAQVVPGVPIGQAHPAPRPHSDPGGSPSLVRPGAGDPGDPRAVARAWVAAGADWLHVVDLDRARRAGRDNLELLSWLVRDCPVPVQVSGGIGDQESLEAALATGAARVNLASTALLDLDWVAETVRRHGERIAVGIDVRGGAVVARGVDVRIGGLAEVLHSLSAVPAATFVVADASRDGRRAGVDAALVGNLAQRLPAPVVASGGVRDLDDIRALRALTGSGVIGAVLGAALYHGAFTLDEALAVAR